MFERNFEFKKGKIERMILNSVIQKPREEYKNEKSGQRHSRKAISSRNK